MTVKSLIWLLPVALVSLIANAIASSSTDETADDSQDIFRVLYENSDQLPDEIAFLSVLQLHYVMRTRNVQHAAKMVQQETGLDDTESEILSDRLAVLYDSVNAEIALENNATGCLQGSPAVSGEEVYAVLERLDDIPETVARARLEELRSSLRPNIEQAFQGWLVSQKSSVSHGKFKMREYYALHGRSADARLAEICSALQSDQ